MKPRKVDAYPGRPVSAGSARTKPSSATSSLPTKASITRHRWSSGIRSSSVVGNIACCPRASPWMNPMQNALALARASSLSLGKNLEFRNSLGKRRPFGLIDSARNFPRAVRSILFHDIVDNDVSAHIPAGIFRSNREHVQPLCREIKGARAGDDTTDIGAAATTVVKVRCLTLLAACSRQIRTDRTGSRILGGFWIAARI